VTRRHTLLFRASGNRVFGEAGGGLRQQLARPLLFTSLVAAGLLITGLLTGELAFSVLLAAVVILLASAVTAGRRRRLSIGLEGEQRSARQLRRLPDAEVFHDVMLGGENADHILVTAEGVFSVEVKNWAQVRADHGGVTSRTQPKRNVLPQARRQAGKLGQLLRVKVTPVVVFVQPDSVVRVRELEGVAVTTLSRLPATLTRLRCAARYPLTPEVRQRCVRTLETQLQ